MKRFLPFLLFLAPVAARALTPSMSDQGAVVDVGTTGQFTLWYPVLTDSAGTENHKIIQKAAHGKTATVSYEGGATVEIMATDAGEVRYEFNHVPADASAWKVNAIIPLTFSQGGKWKVGGTEGAFPAAVPAKPHLFQGHGTRCDLTDGQGATVAFEVPEYSFLEVVDNRAWQWPVFNCAVHVPFNPGQPGGTITVRTGGATARTGPLVDPFGQLKTADWPDKVRSADDLRADAAAEQKDYENLHPPATDAFGGLPDSRERLGLKATGFFHVEKKADNRWLLADPAGNVFFHLGICGVGPTDDWTTVGGRESIYEWLPPKNGEFKTAYMPGMPDVFSFYLANTIRKYGEAYSLEAFDRRMVPRLLRWGFNSVGAFSTIPKSVQETGTPYVRTLPLDPWGAAHLMELPGVHGAWDPFDETNRRNVELAFAKELPPLADDPLLIGYFLNNEPIYEDLPRVLPSLDGRRYAAKRALVASLQRKYGTVEAFNKAWELSARSFDELGGTPLVARTRAASEDVQAFSGEFLEAYFKLVADTFHKYDTHHMLLGNRLQPGTINDERLCRLSGKYLDVMSFNYYTNAIDPDFLGRVQRWTGLPVMLSEFYFSSPRDSGLLGGAEVSSQAERGLAYRQYVEQAAATGYVIGIEWFTLIDQASTGRWFEKFSGERANSGLLSVGDRPWKAMLAEAMKTNYRIYDVALGRQPAFVWDDPRFRVLSGAKQTADAPRAKGPITLDGTTTNWPGIPPNVIPGSRLTQGSAAEGLEGVFRVCWDDANLYVLVNVKDPTPFKNELAKSMLWSADGVELFVGTEKPEEGGPWQFLDRQILIGASAVGPAPVFYARVADPLPGEARVFAGEGGYAIEAIVPWTALGAVPHAGQTILFDLGIDDSPDGKNRRAQIMWSGGAKNSSDRTHWGRVHLLP